MSGSHFVSLITFRCELSWFMTYWVETRPQDINSVFLSVFADMQKTRKRGPSQTFCISSRRRKGIVVFCVLWVNTLYFLQTAKRLLVKVRILNLHCKKTVMIWKTLDVFCASQTFPIQQSITTRQKRNLKAFFFVPHLLHRGEDVHSREL